MTTNRYQNKKFWILSSLFIITIITSCTAIYLTTEGTIIDEKYITVVGLLESIGTPEGDVYPPQKIFTVKFWTWDNKNFNYDVNGESVIFEVDSATMKNLSFNTEYIITYRQTTQLYSKYREKELISIDERHSTGITWYHLALDPLISPDPLIPYGVLLSMGPLILFALLDDARRYK